MDGLCVLLVIPRVREGRALGLEIPGPVDGPVPVQHEAAVTPSQRCKHTMTYYLRVLGHLSRYKAKPRLYIQ